MKEKKQDASERADSTPKRLYRSEANRVIGGVAGGLGLYFNIDPTFIRIVFVLITVFGGSGIILYVILWLIIPSESSSAYISDQTIRENVGDMKNRVKSMAKDLRFKKQEEDSRFVWGGLILFLGLIFLFQNYGMLRFMDIGRLWPLILIFFGISILIKK